MKDEYQPSEDAIKRDTPENHRHGKLAVGPIIEPGLASISDPDLETAGTAIGRSELNTNSGTDSAAGEPGILSTSEMDGQSRVTAVVNFSQVTLGSVLIALDKATTGMEQAREMVQAEGIPERTPQSVLVPMNEWEEQFGVSTDLTARYLAIGMMVDAKEKAGSIGKIASRFGKIISASFSLLWRPFNKSWPFSSMTSGFNKAVERGDSQVKQWITKGRQADAHSRTLAQAALSQLADDAMDGMVENERIQRFIQEIVSAQSMGIVDEAIEEIRERTLSSDIFIERPLRRFLRRPERDEVPRPAFDPEVVRTIKRQHVPRSQNSLLGYYAGFISRLFAFGLDIAFMAAFMAISSWLLSTVITLFGLEVAFASFREATSIDEAAGAIIISFTGVLVVTGYFVLFWVLTGQTFGMMLLGLRVVNHDGRPINLRQGIVRLVGLVFSFLTFFLGVAWILVDDKREGWQDKLARSHVVYAWDANPDETFLYEYISGTTR